MWVQERQAWAVCAWPVSRACQFVLTPPSGTGPAVASSALLRGPQEGAQEQLLQVLASLLEAEELLPQAWAD